MSENEIKMTQEEFEILDRILSGLLHGAERLAVIAAIDKEGFSRNTPPKEETKPLSVEEIDELITTHYNNCFEAGDHASEISMQSMSLAKAIYNSLPEQREVKWPEFPDKGHKSSCHCGYCQKKNFRKEILDACKKAYEEAQPASSVNAEVV